MYSHWSAVVSFREMKMAENTGLFGVFGIALILPSIAVKELFRLVNWL